MSMRGSNDTGRNAVSLLATSFVFTAGLLACAGIIFAFANDPTRPMVICLSSLLVLGLVLWLLRDKPESPAPKQFSSWSWRSRRRHPDPFIDYRPRKRRSQAVGTNHPPTAERVRELKQSVNTWVPSGRVPKR